MPSILLDMTTKQDYLREDFLGVHAYDNKTPYLK